MKSSHVKIHNATIQNTKKRNKNRTKNFCDKLWNNALFDGLLTIHENIFPTKHIRSLQVYRLFMYENTSSLIQYDYYIVLFCTCRTKEKIKCFCSEIKAAKKYISRKEEKLLGFFYLRLCSVVLHSSASVFPPSTSSAYSNRV